MKDKIDIEKLFSDKLASHESVVSDQVWSGIQSQIGVGASSTAIAAKGISVATKWFIGIASVVAVSTTVLVLNYSETSTEPVAPKQNSLDSTVMITDNKLLTTEKSQETAEIEAPKSSDVIISVEKPSLPIKSYPATSVIELNSKGANASETLILKQATPSAPKTLPVYIDENKSMEENRQVVSRVELLQLPVRSKTNGSVEAWNNTNIFSPNNDGVNDFFFLDCKDLKEFSITIVNEKNAVVFVSNDPNFKWDGIDYKSSEMVPEGNYGYIVFAVDVNNNPIKLFNSLTVSK